MKLRTRIDCELVKQLVNSDESAFSELYIRYKSKLYAFCFTFMKSTSEAEDLVQEIFIYIWESRKDLNPNLSFSSYIYTIARNRIFNYLRKVNIKIKVEKKISTIVLDNKNLIESELIYKEYLDILKQIIEKLPPQQQRIFNMSREKNFSHKEIAEILNISVYTVQEHISKSLYFIKEHFSKIELPIKFKTRSVRNRKP